MIHMLERMARSLSPDNQCDHALPVEQPSHVALGGPGHERAAASGR